MTTLDTSWVTPANGFTTCEKCGGIENVFRIQLIYDVGTYLCRACITEAAVLSNRETLAMGEVT